MYFGEATQNDNPIYNKVYYVNDNIVFIVKGKYSVIVAKNDLYETVFDPNYKYKGSFFNCICKKHNNSEECYEKWLHHIGKMISKEESSKYFANHKLYEHLRNGNCTEKDDKYIIQLMNDSYKIVKDFGLLNK